jgi:Rrf2 family protein
MLAKSTEYAIRALVYIQLQNWKKKHPGVQEIAKEIEAPEAFTAKILQTLTRHEIVDSRKGRGGGFLFNEEQLNLTLYEVILVMEGDFCFTKCGFGFKHCNDANPCPLHDRYAALRKGFLNIAKTETIQMLSKSIVEEKAYLRPVMIHE